MPNKKDHPFKNHKMSFAMRAYFSSITLLFTVLGVVSPTLAGHLALRLFMTPTKFGTPKRERALHDSAKQTFVIVRNRKISVRSWGDDNAPTILLSHGWGGRCTQFHAFITPLVEAGYRVLGFDVPGHGDSEGERTNMMDVALVISEIAKNEKPFEAIIGHSFGTGTALLALDKYPIKTNKVILIGYFSDVIWITELFGSLFDLRDSTIKAMHKIALKKFATTYAMSWGWDDISPLQTVEAFKGDLLLIHDELDHEVPIEQAIPLQKKVPRAQIMTTTGFGHRKILMNKKVVQRAIDFISDS